MPTLFGLDLGTSSFKVSAYRHTGEHLGTVSRATPWQTTAGGTELDPDRFAAEVRTLLDECAAAHAAGQVAGIGVTGMAETMFVETGDGRLQPARAWYEQRRKPELPGPEWHARTGLQDALRTPAVEFRRLAGLGQAVSSWSGLPEYAVQVLGGARVAERSLAARTGLVDVLAGDWSPALLAWAGVEAATRPAIQSAGRAAGAATVPGRCDGAVLTVAGHDHVVAALGAGAGDGASVFDSLGTGEAVIARIAHAPEDLDADAVARFNAASFNVGLGLGEGELIAFAGLGTGNRFNLLLSALAESGYARHEVMDASARNSLVTEVSARRLHGDALDLLEILFGPGWQELRRSRTARADVRRTVRDLAGARALWWTAVERASRNTRASLDALEDLAPVPARLVAAGGWLANAGVRAVRQRVIGSFQVPPVDQCGTRGAALLAGAAAGIYASPTDFPRLASTP